MGISLNANWYMPELESDPAYIESAETELQFNIGWFAHPILIDGDYPAVMRGKVLRSIVDVFAIVYPRLKLMS